MADGSIHLVEIPDALFTFWTVAYEQGRSSRDEDVHRLRVEADRLWLLAMPQTERRDYLLDRLDEAARLANRPDVDDVLDEAWHIYLNSLDNIRQPIMLHPTEHGRKVA
ncbi:hypothetical protein [Microbacterium soli]|uniref:hypothetical protein n=1 Tax=Microbacterium soli TaxID=446075 RepID=UPI0031D141A2